MSAAAYTVRVELRSATRVDTRIYAIGLDTGARALEVAQRGFSTMLSNQMSQLGRWDLDGPRPVLRLADDAVPHLLERERSSRSGRVSVGLAAPAWFGIAERTQLADVVDGRGRYQFVACSTLVAAAVGWSLAQQEPLRCTRLLVIDLGLGTSAAVVDLGEHRVRELVSVGLPPVERATAHSAPRRHDPSAVRRSLVQLSADALEAGCGEVERVLVVSADRSAAELEQVLVAVGGSWADRPLDLLEGRSQVARGAAFLADPIGGRAVFGLPSLDVEAEVDAGIDAAVEVSDAADAVFDAADAVFDEESGARFVVEGALARAVGVLLDDVDGVGSVHAVVPRGSRRPSVHEQLFDLGPDDGSAVFLELFEAVGLTRSTVPADHRLVATAHVRPSGRVSDEATVRFVLHADGRFALEPAGVWDLDWADDADATVVAVRPHLVEVDHLGTGPAVPRPAWGPVAAPRGVAPLSIDDATVLTPPGDPLVVEVEPPSARHVEVEPCSASPADGDGTGPALELGPTGTPPDGGLAWSVAEPEVEVEVEAPGVEPAPITSPVEGPSSGADTCERPAVPEVAVPEVPAVLWRCERAMSNEVGRMVTIRSLPALLGCADDAADEILLVSARRLEQALPGCSGVAEAALRDAVAAVRQVVATGRRDRYFGGTLDEVLDEVARVVDHLMVVVGSVSPAEQRRLVLDAQLLGLSPDHARDAVERLVPGVPAPHAARHETSEPAPDETVAWVGFEPSTGAWRLEAAPLETWAGPPIRVLLDPS